MITANLERIRKKLPQGVTLVAVSKFHPVEAIMEAYSAGQRVFAESRPQELLSKVHRLPGDIRWHFIGHLQTNKLKMVLPYVELVQSVDSERLLSAIDKWAGENGRRIDVLLEEHIASEESKQGFSAEEILSILSRGNEFPNVRFRGLMGMATLTDDTSMIEGDFERIRSLFDEVKTTFTEISGDFSELSIGMSSDWETALRYGSTMVRIGTAIFGERVY